MLKYINRVWNRLHGRKLYRVNLSAAAKPRAGIAMEATQSKEIPESVVAVLKQEDQTTAYRYTDSDGNAVAADLNGDSVSLDLRGRSKIGEEGTLEVCRILVERLRKDGEDWSDPIDLSTLGSRDEEGVDCKASGPTGDLLIQVTRAERGIWARLAAVGKVVVEGLAIHAAAHQLRATIKAKATSIAQSDRRQLVLALNARDTPNLALPAIVESFQHRHGAWARSLAFRAIWLVGPSVTLTNRLDVTPDATMESIETEREPTA